MITTINNKHNKLNVPNLRLKEFQGEWITYKIKDVLSIGNGRDYKHLSNGEIPVFGTGGYMTSVDECLYDGETTFIGRKGSINKPFYYNGKFWTVDTLFYTHSFNGITPKFTYCLFQTINWLKYNEASGVPSLSKDTIEKIKINIPGLEEQNKIAKLMFVLDERIATQNKIIDKLQSLIKGLNDFLYTQYGGELLTSFAELGTSYSGLSGKSAQDFGSGKPFITYLNVYSNNVIKENDFQYVAIKDDEKQNVVKYGDVLFTLSSETPEEVGVGSVYLGKEKVYLNSFCFGIHITNTEVAFPPYLSYYVSLTAFRKFTYPYAQGSTRFNLCKADFEKASIKLPTLADQKRIYSVLGHIDCKIETERQMLNLYNSQKQYLLRQMFI
ncbi:restriction endonuclease subunit S [Prevotella sp.]|uniref:restriction endonuclease subunit S n=2 Tax=Prevotella sp. TaxID=59823 RepID=UPI0027E2C5EA|nr:restriction endonuclease subunit S [Prevotella sp.]